MSETRLLDAFRAALIKARSGVIASGAVAQIADRYTLTEAERAELSRSVMQSAISLNEEARANSLRMTPVALLAEAYGVAELMSGADAEALIAHDPFFEMSHALADPLAAIGIVTIRKIRERDVSVDMTERGEVVVMVLRALRLWPTLSAERQSLLGNPCLSEGSAGSEMAVHGLYRLNASRLYRGRSHDGYHYLRTELGRITWVLGRKRS